MKKWVTVLAVITCVFGLTACGSSKSADVAAAPGIMTEEEAITAGENIVNNVASVVESGTTADYADNAVYTEAFKSWETALEDMKSFNGFLDESAEVTAEEITITIGLDGADHDATTTIIANGEGQLTSISTNVKYSFGELMEQAGLNTVLGMGTTFCILILISLIISLFPLIGKAQKASEDKKKAAKAAAVVATPVAAASEAVVAEETDDTELIAVISAAIAASEGAQTTDGFVVRSIRKVGKKNWKF